MKIYTAKGVEKDPSLFRVTAFDEQITAEYSPIIELKSNYGLSALRDIETETNGGTVTHSGAEYVLSTSATTSSVARLTSAERGRYQPGLQCVAGIGMRRPTAPTGNLDWKAGYYDTEDGFGFGEDSTGLYVFTRKSSSDTKVYQTNWNGDKLDGTGPSGLTVDLSKGVVFRFPFTWYGFGSIHFAVLYRDSNFQDQYVIVHSVNPDGISVTDPNLPINAEVTNGATATDLKIYVAGRQFGIFGRYAPNRRVTSDRRLSLGSITTTFLPMVTFRKKSAFDSVSVKVAGFDILADADLIYQIRVNGSLTSASYNAPSDHTAAETAVEADIAATAISGGEVIYSGLVESGQGNNSDLSAATALNLDFPDVDEVTLCVRTVSGSGATASCVFRVEEEW